MQPIEATPKPPRAQKPQSRHKWCYIIIAVCVAVTVAINARHIRPDPEDAWEPFRQPEAIYNLAASKDYPAEPYFLDSPETPHWQLVEAVVDVAIRNVQNLRAWHICWTEVQAVRQLAWSRSQIAPSTDGKGDPAPVDYAFEVKRMGVISQTLRDTSIPCTNKDPNKANYIGFRLKDSRDGRIKTLAVSDLTVLGDEIATVEYAMRQGICYEHKKAEYDKFLKIAPGGALPRPSPLSVAWRLNDYETELFILNKLGLPCK